LRGNWSLRIRTAKYLFGVQYILELARTAYSLYLQRDMTGRREIILFLLSNSLFTRGNITPVYKKPFDILAKMRTYPIESGRLDAIRTAFQSLPNPTELETQLDLLCNLCTQNGEL